MKKYLSDAILGLGGRDDYFRQILLSFYPNELSILQIGAIEEKKKVICLYRNLDNQRLSAMISGNTNITKYCYDSLKDLKQKIYNLL